MTVTSPLPIQVHAADAPDGTPGVRIYEARDGHGVSVPGPTVVVVGSQHGNEHVGSEVVRRLTAVAEERLRGGRLVTVVANMDALALDLRHTPDGQDMNRLWDRDTLAQLAQADVARLDSEERRVRALTPWVVGADAILDLHSTSRPSPPHLLFRDDLRHMRLASRLGVTRLVTGVHERALLDGGLLCNAGLGPGEPGDFLGFTLEAGQHLDPANLDHAWHVTTRFLVELGVWHDPDDRYDAVPYEVYDLISRFQQAPAGTEPYRFVGFEGGPPGGGRHAPTRRLESFEEVEADEIVLRRDDGEVVRASAPFTMLMPAPTAGPGEDLFYFCQRRHTALEARPDTDEEARAEARAIERMLDLMSWDEAHRGTLLVSVTTRRTLALCVDLVARAVRLPAGHPHRRLTIVGRGDGVGDDAERRGGAAWSEVVRRAAADGVPVERIQLLRGASLGWLEQVARSAGQGGLGLRLSARQPHTISVAVVGDLPRALDTGDLRHVAVALVIEASSVEPDGDDVRVRIARVGVLGARPALLRAVHGLVESLRREHDHAVAAGVWGDVDTARAPDGTLRGGDADQLATAVRAHQTGVWRTALRHVVTRPVSLEEGTLGTWLARTMASSGVLDAPTLTGWLAERTEEGWRIDPSRLDLDPPTGVSTSPVLPPSVLTSDDVDRDNIERWMGWKRYVRDVQSVPGTRGRDLEILLDGAAIQRRIATWFDEIRTAAAAEPGCWLVAISGDGMRPARDHDASGWEAVRAHRRLLLDPNLQYLRVQHAQGTHLGWLKDFVDTVAVRPPVGAPVAMSWETEHGGAVSVVLAGRRAESGPSEPWTLEPWTVERCLVIVSGGAAGGYRVALLAEPDASGSVNQELVHFARTHLERLLRQSSWRFTGRAGPRARMALEGAARQLVSEQAARLEDDVLRLREVPDAARVGWVMQRLGLYDEALAEALVGHVLEGRTPTEAARLTWGHTEAWPGALWDTLERGDLG